MSDVFELKSITYHYSVYLIGGSLCDHIKSAGSGAQLIISLGADSSLCLCYSDLRCSFFSRCGHCRCCCCSLLFFNFSSLRYLLDICKFFGGCSSTSCSGIKSGFCCFSSFLVSCSSICGGGGFCSFGVSNFLLLSSSFISCLKLSRCRCGKDRSRQGEGRGR